MTYNDRLDIAAQAMWNVDKFRMGDPDNWTGSGDQILYRVMASAALNALSRAGYGLFRHITAEDEAGDDW